MSNFSYIVMLLGALSLSPVVQAMYSNDGEKPQYDNPLAERLDNLRDGEHERMLETVLCSPELPSEVLDLIFQAYRSPKVSRWLSKRHHYKRGFEIMYCNEHLPSEQQLTSEVLFEILKIDYENDNCNIFIPN